jgi:hypothetical protein
MWVQKTKIYNYNDGGTTVSTVKPDTEYTQLYRIVAEDGMVLTNGATTVTCVDTEDVSAWSEVVDVQAAAKFTDEILEKARAYDALMANK